MSFLATLHGKSVLAAKFKWDERLQKKLASDVFLWLFRFRFCFFASATKTRVCFSTSVVARFCFFNSVFSFSAFVSFCFGIKKSLSTSSLGVALLRVRRRRSLLLLLLMQQL